MKLRKTTWALFLILGSFLVFQAILVFKVTIAQYDEAIFLDVARNIARTGLPLRSIGVDGKYYFEHTPAYLYLLGMVMMFITENIVFLRLITVFFAIGSLVLTYLIAAQAQNKLSGLIAVAILALNPFFVVFAYFIYMEVVFCFFILLAIWFFLQIDLNPKKTTMFVVGAALSITTAIMLKEIGLAFLAAASMYVLFFKTSWQKRVLYLLVLIIPTAVLLLGWLSWAAYLDWTRLQESMTRWTGAWGNNNIDPRSRVSNWNWVKDISHFLFGYTTTILLLISLMIAAYHKFKHRLNPISERCHPPKIVSLLLLYLSIAISASMVMSLKEKRHLIALLPTAALLIALLVDWATLWHKIKKRNIYRIAFIITVLVIALSISPLQIPNHAEMTIAQSWFESQYGNRVFNNDKYLQSIHDAGIYVNEHADSQKAIIAVRQGPVIGYYAKKPYWFMYTRPYPENVDLLSDAEFVIVDSTEFWQQTPQENEAIFNYIEQNFEKVSVFVNPYSQVTVYQRPLSE